MGEACALSHVVAVTIPTVHPGNVRLLQVRDLPDGTVSEWQKLNWNQVCLTPSPFHCIVRPFSDDKRTCQDISVSVRAGRTQS